MLASFKACFTRLTIRSRLRSLTLLFLGGFLSFSILSYDTLKTTKVNGPYYDRIVQGKDLIADVLPPPEYIIEAQMIVLKMVNTTDPEQLPPLMRKFERLESDYVQRHKFWVNNLPEGRLKEMMVVEAFEPAKQFFVVARNDLFPLLLNGEQAQASALARGRLHDCYERHRLCIDKVVEMSQTRIAEDEQAARDVVAQRTSLMIAIALILATLVSVGSESLGRRIATRLDETAQVLDAVAAGDLTQRLRTSGEDEIDQMGTALNQAIATSQRNLTAARDAEQTIRDLNADLEQRVAQRTQSLHESEQRLHAILDTAIDSIICINGVGIIESANPATEQMFGYSLAEMIGQNVKMLVPSPHREAHDGHLANLLKMDLERPIGLRREVIGQRKDGTIFPADLAISSTNLSDRHQFTGIVRDISRRKKIETDLAQAKEVAEAANQAKSSFLATMSHELRTPLNGILGMNELLLGTDLTEKQRQFVDASRCSGKMLLQLINDVLDLSKIESGKLELDLQECAVEQLVNDVVEALGPGARQKGLTLQVHVDLAVCVTTLCDGNRLRQILINLIGNAIKFTSSGTITVNAIGLRHEDRQLRVRFAVADSGIGIPEDRRERLFAPFSQVDCSTTRKFGGTGLGLAICKQLVELMNGEIGIESQVGIGSTFWLEVPMTVVEQPKNLPKTASPPPTLAAASADMPPAASVPSLLVGHVLVAEDNRINQMYVTELLKLCGCTCDIAANGDEALEAMQRKHYDLILMDCQMPEMDGFTASREIRRRLAAQEFPHPTPIIALTANALTGDRERCLASGMDDYLTKPIEVHQLQSKLAQFLPAITS